MEEGRLQNAGAPPLSYYKKPSGKIINDDFL